VAGSGTSDVHVAASSETSTAPSDARRIQERTTRTNVQGAPKSTYTHSSALPAAIHELEKLCGPAISTGLLLRKKSISFTTNCRARGSLRAMRKNRLCDAAANFTEG